MLARFTLIDDPEIAAPACAAGSTDGADLEAPQDALHSLRAVQRLLIQAMAHGSDRDVVTAFAEALAVCEDIEVRAYADTEHGRFQIDVTLAGSDRSAAPDSIGQDVVAEGVAFVRLTSGDLDRLHFRGGHDVLLARVGDPTCVSWLLALSGKIGPSREARLLVYADLLDQAVRTVTSHAATRVSWAVLEHLLPSGDQIEAAAHGALTALSAAVDGAGAALVVTMLTGMHVLSLGDADVFSTPRPYGEADEIVATSRILHRYSMTLAVRRLDGRPFTRRERYLLDVATPIFATWLAGVLQQPGYAKDRRDAPRRFDEVLERLAARVTDEGTSLSVVLFKVREGVVQGRAMSRWVTDIRGQLRPSDLAGLVSDSEVAVLLADAGPDHAAAVVERLRRQLHSNEQFGALGPLAVGIASSTTERPIAGSILRAAREDAARRASA